MQSVLTGVKKDSATNLARAFSCFFFFSVSHIYPREEKGEGEGEGGKVQIASSPKSPYPPLP